jgi:hypothetical protein
LKAHTDLVDSNLRAQQVNNGQMLKHLQQANDEIVSTRNEARTMGAELIQYNKTLEDAISTASSTAALENTSMRAMIRKRTTKISNEIRNINKQNTTLLQTLRRSRDTWKHHSSQTDAQSEGSQRSLENVIGSVAEMRTATIFSATNIQMMTDVMRRELQSTLEPVVEQLFNRIRK